jgi:hypothetical protein
MDTQTRTTQRTTPGNSREIDRVAIDSIARAGIAVMRECSGLPDFELLTSPLMQPHEFADARFEQRQITERGHVFAPPTLIRARMRELLAN